MGGLDYRADGGAVWNPSPVFGRFLSPVRLPVGGRGGDRRNHKPAWMEEKKDWLKDNRWKDVLQALQPFLEPVDIPNPDTPVRACFRYIPTTPISWITKAL